MALSEKKNRGEWSELYVLVNLLATGQLQYSHGESESDVFPVVSISRSLAGIEHKFFIADGFVEIENPSKEHSIDRISQHDLLIHSKELFAQIKSGSGRSFTVPCAIEVMTDLGIDKASGIKSKDDLQITIYDPRTKKQNSQGFSIKSFIGSDPSIFNASDVTNLEFTIDRKLSHREISNYNSLGPIELVSSLLSDQCQLTLSRIDERFADNLKMIDSEMVELVGQMVIASYSGQGRTMAEILTLLTTRNPLDYSIRNAEYRYKHKMKDFLEAVALGMRPSDPWLGQTEAGGGTLIVTSSGKILCHHALEKDSLRDYLFDNTYFDTPSRRRWKFGRIYDGKIYLNFQIRVKN
jgi:hypothetical protein